MATIQPIVTDVGSSGSLKVVKWVLPATGDVGAPFRLDRWNVTSVQLFGSAVTAVAINGSMEPDAPANFAPLSDRQGVSLGALAAAGIKTPQGLPVWVQPTLTTGTAVTVLIACHRAGIGAAG